MAPSGGTNTQRDNDAIPDDKAPSQTLGGGLSLSPTSFGVATK